MVLLKKFYLAKRRLNLDGNKYRITPWDRINKGDTVYFKDSGKLVTAKATVTKVIQIENLNREKFQNIIRDFADDIALVDRTYSNYYKKKNYVVLIILKSAKLIEKPFRIDKTGYGTGCAWITVKDIDEIRIK